MDFDDVAMEYDDAEILIKDVIRMRKVIEDMESEIARLTQQNADMAAWINAQCGGV